MYDGVLAPYWVNTGSDVLLRHLLADGPSQIRDGVEALIQGDPVRSVINDKLAFPDLLDKATNIWSFLDKGPPYGRHNGNRPVCY